MASLYITAAHDRQGIRADTPFSAGGSKAGDRTVSRTAGLGSISADGEFYVAASAAPRLAAEFTQALARRGFLIRNCDNYPGLTAAHIRVAIRSAEENDALYAAICEEIKKFMITIYLIRHGETVLESLRQVPKA